MQITIDDAQQYIISILHDGINNGRLHMTPLSWASYDVSVTHAVSSYMRFGPDPPSKLTALLRPAPLRTQHETFASLRSSLFKTNKIGPAITPLGTCQNIGKCLS